MKAHAQQARATVLRFLGAVEIPRVQHDALADSVPRAHGRPCAFLKFLFPARAVLIVDGCSGEGLRGVGLGPQPVSFARDHVGGDCRGTIG